MRLRRLFIPLHTLLDEATNALDNESDRVFQEALEQYGGHRTLIVIAHRLSTIEKADHVIVLKGGHVVESGPPERLLSEGGHFALLYKAEYGRLGTNKYA